MTNSNNQAAYCVEYFNAKKGSVELLKNELLVIAKHSKLEEGCLQYDVLQDKANQNLFILLLKYVNQAAMDEHEKQKYVIDFEKNKMNQLCDQVYWNDALIVS